MGTSVLVWIRGLGFAAGAAIFWLQYFDLKDYLNPEPRRILVLSYFLGFVAAGVGLFLYWILGVLGGPQDPGTSHSQILSYCFFVIGPIEEGVKFLFARTFIFRLRYFDEPIDGLIYSSAIAVGFAGVESLIYTPLLKWPDLAALAITSPLTHSLFASIWGFGTGFAFFRTKSAQSRFFWQLATLVLGMVTHASYDYLLLAHHATLIASALALLVWAFLIAYARRLVQARPLTQGSLP